MSMLKDIFSFLFEKKYIEVVSSTPRRKSIRKKIFSKTKKPFFIKKARHHSQKVQKIIPKPKEIMAGEVTHFFAKIQVGVVKAKKDIAVGDKLHFKGPHTDFIQIIKSMQIDHKDVVKAKKGGEFGLKLQKPVRVTDACFFV